MSSGIPPAMAVALLIACIPAKAATRGQREICVGSLTAMSVGDAAQAQEIDESNTGAPKPSAEQRAASTAAIQSAIDQFSAVGAGLPKTREIVSDGLIDSNGGWLMIEAWHFPNGATGYAGCERFLQPDSTWKNVFEMGDSVENLRSSMQQRR